MKTSEVLKEVGTLLAAFCLSIVGGFIWSYIDLSMPDFPSIFVVIGIVSITFGCWMSTIKDSFWPLFFSIIGGGLALQISILPWLVEITFRAMEVPGF